MPDYNHLMSVGAALAAQQAQAEAIQADSDAASTHADRLQSDTDDAQAQTSASQAEASAVSAASSATSAANSANQAAQSAAAAAQSQACSVWILGNGAPSASMGTNGNNYLDTSGTGNFYQKTAGAWVLEGSLKGPQGNAGTNGQTVWSGSGAPAAGLGVNNDFYIDKTAWAIYGPKTAGAWGAGTSLIGPSGALPAAPASTIVGNNTTGTAVPTNLTAAQVKALLGLCATDVGLGNVLNVAQIPASQLGVANGVATLGANGLVLAAQLPVASSGVSPMVAQAFS